MSEAYNQDCTDTPLDDHRKKAILAYMILSLVQSIDGAALVVVSSVATTYHYNGHGAPYFSGGFIIGALLIFSSLLGFRVYNKGPYYSTSNEAKNEVKCALNCHRATSMVSVLAGLVGLAVIWMFGFCLQQDTQCSFEEDTHENRIIAIVLFCLGVMGIITAAIALFMIRKYSFLFDIILSTGAQPWPSAIYDRRRRRSNHRECDACANTPNLSGGVDNMAFVLPEPPPYSLVDENELRRVAGQLPNYDSHVSAQLPTVSYSVDQDQQNTPQEPPPPYTET